MPRTVRLHAPVAVWAGVIFAASSRSDTGGLGRLPDWLTHGFAYATLSLLLCRAMAGGLGAPLSWRAAALSLALATLYGVSDEWHQSFVPGRDASAADVGKDLIGASVAAAAYRFRYGAKGGR